MNNTYVIGITGTYGKTSCARMLYSYLKTLKYSVNLVSSNLIEITNNTAAFNHNNLNQQEIEYIYRSSNNVDFLIIEAHEDGLLQNAYQNIPFDCRVLTNFQADFNLHRTPEHYLQLKTDFINEGDCLRILNKASDNFESFNQNNSFIFSTDINDTDCSIFPIKYTNTVKNSSLQIQIDQDNITIPFYAQKNQYKNIITVISILKALDLFDGEDFVDGFLSSNTQVAGRNQQFEINNRLCIIDSGNGRALDEFMTTNSDANQYHVKALLNVIGGLNDDSYKSLTANPNFVTLNKFEIRPFALAFGGNLYLALNNLKEFPDFDPCFERVIQKTGGKQYFADYTNINIKFPEHFVEDIIAFTDLNHWEEPSDTIW
jgi:UDP-N-acetylmuramyl tripeptide synthase